MALVGGPRQRRIRPRLGTKYLGIAWLGILRLDSGGDGTILAAGHIKSPCQDDARNTRRDEQNRPIAPLAWSRVLAREDERNVFEV
jgi:hypothetical protein